MTRIDVPLAPGVHRYFGLGLWNSRVATFTVEGLLWLIGIVLYARTTRPSKPAGAYAFWSMIARLTVLWGVGLGGTPPPSLAAVEIVNVILLSAVLGWAYWFARLDCGGFGSAIC